MPASASAIQAMAGKTLDQLTGAGQFIGGLIGRGRNQKNLNNLQNPTYTPNKAISDYYQQALNKAMTSAYNSNFYNQAETNAGRGLATGISALGDRRSGVAGIGGLGKGSQDALNKAGVKAKALQRQALGQLGQATQMKAGDDRYAFDINQEAPFERKYSEFSGKLAANNQLINAGIQNLSNGLTGGGGNPVPQGLGGLGSMIGNHSASLPYATYNPSLAATSGGYTSPASNFPTIQ